MRVHVVSVERLLELVFDWHGEVRFSQVQGLAYQRKPGIGDDCFCAGKVTQKGGHAWLLKKYVAFLPFYSETVSHELTADLLEQGSQFPGRRRHINQNVVTRVWFGRQHFLAQDRRGQKRIPLPCRWGEERKHKE